MRRAVQRPIVGCVARYEGIWRPHWEISHINVRVPRKRRLAIEVAAGACLLVTFGIGFLDTFDLLYLGGVAALLAALPAQEQWSVNFPAVFSAELCERGGRIVFDGEVSSRGRHGHMGSMHRVVKIIRVLEFDPG
jgi:hypothetical protein